MSKNLIILIIILFALSGCTSTRVIESARDRIAELEKLNEAGAARNIELEKLNEAERAGNKELGDLLFRLRAENEQYIEAERNRLEAERLIVDSFSGIFEDGETIIERLIRGHNLIRDYFESLEVLE